MRPLVLALALAAILAGPAVAQRSAVPSVAAEAAWARATFTGAQSGVVYLTLVNNGGAADRLVGAETPVAKRATLHVEESDNGVMRMRPLDGIEIKPGERVVLKPGGVHVMLVGMKRQLHPGERFDLTLDFAKAGKQVVEVAVLKAGAMGMEGQGGMSHDMSGMGMKHP